MSSRKWKKRKHFSFYGATNNKTKDIIRKIQTNIPYDHR